MNGFKKILFPTDFSANADKALAHAIRLAEFDKGEVIVQHVVGDYFERHSHWATIFDPREMPRRHVFRSELPRPIDQRAELQLFIAHHAWIRGASGFVFLGKIIDHLLLKILLLIDKIIRDAQLVRDAAGIHDRLGPQHLSSARDTQSCGQSLSVMPMTS